MTGIAQQHDASSAPVRKRLALDQAEEAIAATTLRLREATEDQLDQLRVAHERSLSTLRGELEPKALEAHKLAEEHERLTSEIAALKSEAIRDVIAFPKTQRGQDLVTGAPSPVTERQLRELHIRLRSSE